MGDIRDYWVRKMLFPKRFIIDKPGMVINCLSRKYGGVKSRHRSVYYFEDLIVRLQLDSAKFLGEEKAHRLWYMIGKDVGVQYFILSGAKQIPNILMKDVLNYVFSGFRSSGCSAANNFIYNSSINSIILSGENNIICRKSGFGDFFSGVLAGLMSSFTGKEYGAILGCEKCPNGCRIIANVDISDGHSPSIEFLEKSKEFDYVNFPKGPYPGRMSYSFGDLVRFKKSVLSEKGNHLFFGKVIIPSPIQMFGCIVKHYEEAGASDVLRRSLVDSAELLMRDILNELNVSDNWNFLRNMLSAFGWGIMERSKRDEGITIDIYYPPFNKYGYLYQALVLNGYLNCIYKRKFKLKSIDSFPGLKKKTLKYLELK